MPPGGDLYILKCIVHDWADDQAIAERLAESIKKSGGTLRLNSPVLRLAYCDTGQRAIGVDLLSGETVIARKAIVSNLTVWDTYGKLIGLNRTPLETKKLLKTLQGPGAYLVYASLEESALARLPGEHFTAGQLELPQGARLLTSPDQIIAICAAPAARPEVEVAAEVAEPELIGRKPKEEESPEE